MSFKRNKGLLNPGDQDKIKQARVLICGVGGMGGVCAEMLTRMGVGFLRLADFDTFDENNLNRQIHSNIDTLGEKKVNVLRKAFLKINPNLKIEVDTRGITEDNVDDLLNGIDIVVNGTDQMYYSLALERRAREKEITIVDAWLTPYASVFVMDKDAPHWESLLKLPTEGKELGDLKARDIIKAVHKEVEYTLSFFNPEEFIEEKSVFKIVEGIEDRPSFAPVVWLSGALMANEVFKIIVGIPHAGHEGIFYNQYTHEICKGDFSKVKGTKINKNAIVDCFIKMGYKKEKEDGFYFYFKNKKEQVVVLDLVGVSNLSVELLKKLTDSISQKILVFTHVEEKSKSLEEFLENNKNIFFYDKKDYQDFFSKLMDLMF